MVARLARTKVDRGDDVLAEREADVPKRLDAVLEDLGGGDVARDLDRLREGLATAPGRRVPLLARKNGVRLEAHENRLRLVGARLLSSR